MSVTPPDIHRVPGDRVTSIADVHHVHLLLKYGKALLFSEGAETHPADLPVCLGYDFDTLPNFHFGLIQPAEITSRLLLPLSNEEAEVNDQKKKLNFFFFKGTGCKIGQRKHNGLLIVNCLFSPQSARPRQREGG